jgi:hypothetical protein
LGPFRSFAVNQFDRFVDVVNSFLDASSDRARPRGVSGRLLQALDQGAGPVYLGARIGFRPRALKRCWREADVTRANSLPTQFENVSAAELFDVPSSSRKNHSSMFGRDASLCRGSVGARE